MFERIGLFFISHLIHTSGVISFIFDFLFRFSFYVIVFFPVSYPFLLSRPSILSILWFIKIANFSRSYRFNKQIFINHNFGANFSAFSQKYKVLFSFFLSAVSSIHLASSSHSLIPDYPPARLAHISSNPPRYSLFPSSNMFFVLSGGYPLCSCLLSYQLMSFLYVQYFI